MSILDAASQAKARILGPRPRLIVEGNQKSGTSVIAALLARVGGLQAGIDIPCTWPPQAEALIRGDVRLADLRRRHAKQFAHRVLKEPNLTFVHEQVQRLYPRARFVFVVRDPRDNIRSILDRMGLPGTVAARPDGPSDAWSSILDGPAWGLPGGSPIEVLCHRWNRCAQTYIQHEAAFTLVRYEDFCDDKQGTIEAAAKQAGIRIRHSVGIAAEEQFQTRGSNRDLPLDTFFKSNLAVIEDLCATTMRHFRYV